MIVASFLMSLQVQHKNLISPYKQHNGFSSGDHAQSIDQIIEGMRENRLAFAVKVRNPIFSMAHRVNDYQTIAYRRQTVVNLPQRLLETVSNALADHLACISICVFPVCAYKITI